MRRILFNVLPLILAVLCSGCIKSEMTLTFELSPDVNTQCRLVYYASARNGGMLKETAADISAGKAEMKLPQRYPSIIYLFSTAAKSPSAIIYAKGGDKIVVSGKSRDISEWDIKGNDITDELTSWRLKNKSVLNSHNEEKVNQAVATYVKEHPSSEASVILLYVYFTRRGHEEEFSGLLAKVKRSLLEDKKLMNALSSADLIAGLPDTPRYPSRIIMLGEEGYADTLSLAKGKGTLLLFCNGRGSVDNISADSLKSIVARRGEKTVAELYMDGDSVSWRRHLASDSIAGMRRLWMPLATADSLSMNMGIRRAPYYVVFDSNGKVVYRGDKWKDASKKFESLP